MTTLKRCLKCQVEQAWLFSNLLGRRQFVNIHVFSLTGEIELICLTNAHFSQIITSISDCLNNFESKITPHFRQYFENKKNLRHKRVLRNYIYNKTSTDSSSTDESVAAINDDQLNCVNVVWQTEKLLDKIDLLFENFPTPNSNQSTNERVKNDADLLKCYIYLGNINRTQKLTKVCNNCLKRMIDCLLSF